MVLATLANTGPVNALLTPLHRWSTSKKRVAEAVEAEERERRQRALLEEQEEEQRRSSSSPNGLIELLRDTVTLPRPIRDTYDALLSVAALPERLAQTGKQTAENLAAAAEAAGAVPGRVRETVGRGQETVKTAQEVLVAAPARVQGVVTATQELPGRVERALEEGAEAVEAAVDAGRKASEVIETLPDRWVGGYGVHPRFVWDRCERAAIHYGTCALVVKLDRSNVCRKVLCPLRVLRWQRDGKRRRN